MPVATLPNLSLYYEIEGEGPPLLLISGLGGQGASWAPAKPRLAEKFQVITFDARGTGRSSVPPGDYTIDEMADDAAALLQELQIDCADIVGWSLGGSVLQSMLVRHGHLIRRSVLLNALPCYTAVQHAWLDALLALKRSGADPLSVLLFGLPWVFTPRVLAGHSSLEALARATLERDLYPTPLQGFEAQAAGLRQYDSRASLPQIEKPVLVLCGAEDVLTPVAQSAEIAALIPGAKLQVLPRGGHSMVVEYTDDSLGAVCAFLEAP